MKSGVAVRPAELIQLRSMVVGSVFALLGAAGGSAVLFGFSGASPLYGGMMLACGAFSLILLGLSVYWRRRSDYLRRVTWLAAGQAVIAILMVMVAVYFSAWATAALEAGLAVFRPSYAFVPFVYLACSLLLPSRESMRVCWGVYALQLAIVLPALWLDGIAYLQRDGEMALLLWLFIGNPLFLLMLGALPGYRLQVRELIEQAALGQQLRESEDRFRLVLRGLQVGAWGWELSKGDRRWFSERFYSLLGYGRALPAPEGGTLRDHMHPDDVQQYADAVAKALDAGDDFNVDVRMRMAAGDFRWFNIRGCINRDRHGMVSEMAGAIADIHDAYLATQELRTAQRRMEHLAYHDDLTALHNRRYFNQQIEREHGRAVRMRQPLSLLLLDIDHFKLYNDHHGHFAGDEVLQDVAGILRACASRATDVCARIGGEEFAVLLPETSAENAMIVAERIRTLLYDRVIPHDAAPLLRVTASIGVTTWLPTADDVEPSLLQEEADAALYAAKNGGRNQTRHYRNDVTQAMSRG
jgi:diguanylate cyclase (GGDEF)-like protein